MATRTPLNHYLRRQIMADVLTHKHFAAWLALAKAEAKIADDLNNEMYNAGLRKKMQALPVDFLYERYSPKLPYSQVGDRTHPRYDGRWSLVLFPGTGSFGEGKILMHARKNVAELGKAIGVKSSSARRVHSGGSFTTSALSPEAVTAFKDHNSAKTTLQAAIVPEREELLRMLGRFKAFEDLHKHFPEIEPLSRPYIPGPRQSPASPKVNLPAIDYAALAAKYGLPPDA